MGGWVGGWVGGWDVPFSVFPGFSEVLVEPPPEGGEGEEREEEGGEEEGGGEGILGQEFVSAVEWVGGRVGG